ncbi:MAG: hypothetical protein IIW40_00210 [Clostridia bacterium]|nr:hypothetical protein [Clostridia bacterium]
MQGIVGFMVGFLAAWLIQARRLLPRNRGEGGLLLRSARKCRREERRLWEQTRNFLRYDGTVMLEIKSFKEEIYE